MESVSLVNKRRDLTPEEKTAVILASLDSKTASAILQQCEPGLMVRLTNAVRKLGVIPGTVRDQIIAECLQGVRELGEVVQGDDRMAISMLTQAVGEKRASALLAESAGPAQPSFADLAELTPEQIAELVSHEQAGIIALVMRYLPGETAAAVLGLLPSDLRRKVIVFICTAAEPSDEVVARVSAILSAKSRSSKKVKKARATDRLNMVVGIMQHTDRKVEEDLLSALQEKSEQLAKNVRDRLFTFEDLVKLSDVALRRIMQEIDMGALAIALRNANMELREKFFRNMSKRAAQGLKEEMDFAQKVRLSDVQAKQTEIVSIVRNLEQEGQLTTGAADEYV